MPEMVIYSMYRVEHIIKEVTIYNYMNIKLATGLVAIASFGVVAHMLNAGMPQIPLMVSLVASTGAVGLIIVEWSRV